MPVFLCLSGALRQEKLELSAQVKKLHATVDHLQGSLNQVHEEVTLRSKSQENIPSEGKDGLDERRLKSVLKELFFCARFARNSYQ